jgi:hypothetical protein
MIYKKRADSALTAMVVMGRYSMARNAIRVPVFAVRELSAASRLAATATIFTVAR